MRSFFAWVATGSLVFGVLPACGGDAFEEATDTAGGAAGASAGSAGTAGGATGGSAGATGGSAGATGGSAGATGGSAGATGGSAGTTGGSAGATGGSAGATGGSAGATGGSAGATGGSAGATGGSAGATGGSAGATGGSAGAGGSCSFDACSAAPANKPPSSTCTTCTQAVCKQHPSCCSSDWDESCAMFAQLNQECGCQGLVCGGVSVSVGLGKCWQGGGACNPVTGGGCAPSQPPNQCTLSTDSGQPQAFCTQVGDRPACTECNPSSGKNCQQGFSCVAGACVRLCCLNAECGVGGTCAPGLIPGDGELGICLK